MKAEYIGNDGFLQRDSVEHEGYAEARNVEQMETKEKDNARKTRTIRIYNIHKITSPCIFD